MRKNPTKRVEQFRMSVPASERGGPGAFMVPFRDDSVLRIIMCDGRGWAESGMSGQPWEHVSVSVANRCPTWEEMDFVKDLFWSNDELVLQFHVPKAAHINHHPNCLHLWRPTVSKIPLPPEICV